MDIGIVSKNIAFDFGYSGVMLRASGVPWDLRFCSNYEIYDLMNCYIPVGYNGDSYDRYLIRLEELRSSLFIIFQCLNFLQNDSGLYSIEDFKVVPPYREYMKTSMSL